MAQSNEITMLIYEVEWMKENSDRLKNYLWILSESSQKWENRIFYNEHCNDVDKEHWKFIAYSLLYIHMHMH